MSEHRIARRDPCMARKRQIKSAADAISTNRRDDGLRRIRDRTHHALAVARELERRNRREIRDLRNLGADGKRAFGSSDHRAGQFASFYEFHNLCFDFRQKRALEPWESVVAFKRQQQNVVVLRDAETAAHCRD